MIEISFADLKAEAKWEKLGFRGQRHQMIVDGLNLAGFCRNKVKEDENKEAEESKRIKECGEYNVLPIGFINTTDQEKQGDSFLKDIKRYAVKVNQGILTHQGIKKLYDQDHDHNKICPECKDSFQIKWYEQAIFHKCKFRIAFKMSKEEKEQEVEGLIAHQNKFAKFDQNLKECRSLDGIVCPLTDNQDFEETFLSWLWEHDL